MNLRPSTTRDIERYDDTNHQKRTDHSLVRRYRNGDEQAASAIYQRYAARLNGLAKRQLSHLLARRVDAEDIVQSAFGSFFRRVRDGNYDAPDGGTLWSLLVVIALHKVQRQGEFQRAAKRDVARTVNCASQDGPIGRDETLIRDLGLSIGEIVESLNPHDQRIVELRLDSHNVADIAARTQRSKRTVERVLQAFRLRTHENP